MSDHELRDAERVWRMDPSDHVAFDRLQTALARLGRPLWCVECRERESYQGVGLGAEPWCRPCLVSALEHGHLNVGHDDPEAWLLDLCRYCRVDAKAAEPPCGVTGCSEPAALPLGVCRAHAWENDLSTLTPEGD